jgi:uncharacterized protein (TIGR00369 family)
MPAITLYLDFVSPYAYLAWPQVCELADRRGLDLALEPVLFAGLLALTGGVGPAEIAAKRRWLWSDVIRSAAVAGIPLAGPPAHPFNPLVALRVALASAERDGRDARDGQRAVVDALFTACWARGEDIASEAGVHAALARAGLDAGGLLARAAEPSIKPALRDRTDQAVARGVFGVPTVVVDGALFFGQDRLGDVERHLDGRDPIDAARVEAMLARPVGANRARGPAVEPARGPASEARPVAGDPALIARVGASFARQTLMATIGARLVAVRAGEVEIELGFRDDLSQQHGYVHAGVITAIADSACGYAALTRMPEDHDVLSVEYKVNLLTPASGTSFVARGEVIKAGRTLTVCRGSVIARGGDLDREVAVIMATMMAMPLAR